MMEPAKVDHFCYALAAQGKRLFELEQMLFSLDPGFMAVSAVPDQPDIDLSQLCDSGAA